MFNFSRKVYQVDCRPKWSFFSDPEYVNLYCSICSLVVLFKAVLYLNLQFKLLESTQCLFIAHKIGIFVHF